MKILPILLFFCPVFLFAQGNVGIGTTNPLNKLSILGNSTSSDPVLKSESTFSCNVHVHAVHQVG